MQSSCESPRRRGDDRAEVEVISHLAGRMHRPSWTGRDRVSPEPAGAGPSCHLGFTPVGPGPDFRPPALWEDSL